MPALNSSPRSSLERAVITRAAGEAMVLRALRALRDYGGDPDAPLKAAGVAYSASELFAGAIERLSASELHAVSGWANVAASDLDADRMGRARFRGGDYRLLFYCLVGDHSLRQAIERAEEVFAAVDGRLGSLELRVERDCARLRLARRQGQDTSLSFAVALHGLSNYHNILEWLIGSSLPAIAELDFAPQFAADIEQSLLPFAVQMGCARQSLCFSAAYLDYPVIRSFDEYSLMPSLNFLFEVPTRDTSLEVAERARRSLARRLREEGSLCTLPQLAEMLHLSEATLRRRLIKAGTSFRELRDGARRQLALELLRRTSLSMEAISDRLDFCDSDAFRRAMQGWTGTSPTAYRRGALGEADLLR